MDWAESVDFAGKWYSSRFCGSETELNEFPYYHMNLKSSKFRAASSLCVAALSLGWAEISRAAISFTGEPVTLDFNSMAGTAVELPFLNDYTIKGFYLYLSGGASVPAGVPDAVYRGTGTASTLTGSATVPPTTTYPSGSSFAAYFIRSSDAATDVRLGLYNTDGNSSGVGSGYVAAGIALVNNTGQSIPSVMFDYIASASSATGFTNADPVSVSYSIGATGVADADGVWTTVAGMGYSVSGNAVVTQPSVDTINGLDWQPGQTLFIRFKDMNVGSTDRLSYVDNIVFSAVPEPSALALSGLGIGLLALRRRR